MADRSELSPELELLLEQKTNALSREVAASRELAHSEANRARNQAFILLAVAVFILALLAVFGLTQFIENVVNKKVEERVAKEVNTPLAPAQEQIALALKTAEDASVQAQDFATQTESVLAKLQQTVQDAISSYETGLSENLTATLTPLQEEYASKLAASEAQITSFSEISTEIKALKDEVNQELAHLQAIRTDWTWKTLEGVNSRFQSDAIYPAQIAVNSLTKTVYFRGQLVKQDANEPSTVSSTGALFKLPFECSPLTKRAFIGPSSVTVDFREFSNFNQFVELPNGQIWIDEQGSAGMTGSFDRVYLEGISYDISDTDACLRSL